MRQSGIRSSSAAVRPAAGDGRTGRARLVAAQEEEEEEGEAAAQAAATAAAQATESRKRARKEQVYSPS